MKPSTVPAIVMSLSLGATAFAGQDAALKPQGASPGVSTKEKQAQITPQQALQALKDGNNRFVNGAIVNQIHYRRQAPATAQGQYPHYAIVSCLDSRISVDDIFDLNNGDAFNARVAGNIINDDILGSLEFATAVSGADVIVVLGHTNCGAVKGACDGVKLGNLTGLLDRISPAVSRVGASWTRGEKNSKNHDFVETVGEENVRLQMGNIEKSPTIKGLLDSGKAILVGAIYDLETGSVRFLN